MAKVSAGLLMYRQTKGGLEILLAHPGGPIWKNKDEGGWSIPKGEIDPEEDELSAAQREFAEETGFESRGPFIDLGEIKQKGGKKVRAWAFVGDCDPQQVKSNTFEMEWPPRSGRRQEFPEVDRVAFFDLNTACKKINPAQARFLEVLNEKVGDGNGQEK
jgi:predicted NUDIX family NTP pyrophosphohydrolase